MVSFKRNKQTATPPEAQAPTAVGVGDEPTMPRPLPPPPSPFATAADMPPPGSIGPQGPAGPSVAFGVGDWGADLDGVAAVLGSTAIAQIVIGSPSPSVEPAVIAPKYQSLPFRPDTVIDGWSTEAITVRGVSQRGHLHRYNGAPRQDDFTAHHLPDGRVVITVADGVSGAAQSHLGASTATKYAADVLCTHPHPDAVDWTALIKSTAWALTERTQALLGLVDPDPVRAEEQLATTLVCVVVEPTSTGSLRAELVGVGDSGAWLLLSSGRFVELLGAKAVTADGMSSSAVAGLPRVPAEVVSVVVEITPGEVLVIGTDGIGDPLGSGEGGVGNLLREVLTGPGTPSLIEFAHAVDFSRETFDDDRTLVAIWPRPPTPTPPKSPARHRRSPTPPPGPPPTGLAPLP
jgi:serine/threonine protein phosphatase PrpC